MLIAQIAANKVNPIPDLSKVFGRRTQVRIERIHHSHFRVWFGEASPHHIRSQKACAPDNQDLHKTASIVRSIPSARLTRGCQPVVLAKRLESATKLRASMGAGGCGGST